MRPLILASASPRRRELLGVLGQPFEVQAASVDERPRAGETPPAYVRRVAREKADAAFRSQTPDSNLEMGDRLSSPNTWALRRWVIACDTEVILDGQVLGKPKDAAEAVAMLKKLRGRTHEVISAIVLMETGSGKLSEAICRSTVPMRNYSDAEIETYVASGDPFDKAGAYAIQHAGFQPVEGFAHCYASVMGLPLCHLTRLFRRWGLEPDVDVPAACQQFTQYECPVYAEILNARDSEWLELANGSTA